MRGQRHAEGLADGAVGLPGAHHPRQPAYGVVGGRDVGRVGRAVALHRGHVADAGPRCAPHGRDRVVQGLHDQGDDGAPRPGVEVVEVLEAVALLPQLLAPGPPARLVGDLVDQHRRHQRHHVASRGRSAPARCGCARRGGSDEVIATPSDQSTASSLAVAPRIASELVRVRTPSRSEIARQLALRLEPVEQPLGAEGRRGEDDLVGGERPGGRAARQLRLGPAGRDLVAAAGAGAYVGHRGERVHDGTVLLGEVEVVLHQGVLGVVPAPGHAGAAVDAGGALGSGAAEVRVGHLLALGLVRVRRRRPRRASGGTCRPRPSPRRPSSSPRRRASSWVLDARPASAWPGRSRARSSDFQSVMCAHGGSLVERVQGLVERVGVDQRAATDAGAGEDEAVVDEVDALDAVEPQLGLEDEALHVAAVAPAAPRPRTAPPPRARRPCSPSRSAAAR